MVCDVDDRGEYIVPAEALRALEEGEPTSGWTIEVVRVAKTTASAGPTAEVEVLARGTPVRVHIDNNNDG